MSTVDPERAREERRRAWREGPASRIVLAVAGLALGLFAVILGVGFMVDVDSSRITSLNSVFADWDSNLDGLRWTFPVGMVGVLLGVFGMVFAASASTGRHFSFPVAGPVTIGVVGAAIGVSIAAPMMTEPLTVGTRTDPVFFEHEPWGPWDWFWYEVTWWGPLLAWTLAAVAIGIAILARRRRRARRELLATVLASGLIARGVVTKAPVPSSEGSNYCTTISVRFVDHGGPERWTRCSGAWSKASLPQAGKFVAVLFDPAAAGDERRIWVGPVGSVDVDGFTRWGFGV